MINYNFKLLWIGKLISQLGDKFYAIALAWWILQKTSSTVSMGLFMFASVVPGIVVGLFSGAISDRWNRKYIMVISDAVRGTLVLMISVLAYLDILRIWQVFVIGISLSVAGAFFDPSSQAMLPDIVRKEDLSKANSMCQMVSGVCSTLGPMLGALTVSLLGTGFVFLMNSISFFAAMILAGFLRYEAACRDTEGAQFHIFRDIGEGLRYIRMRKTLIKVLAVIGAAHFFVGSLSVVLPFLANKLSGIGVNNLGLLEMLLGIGLLVGSVYRRLKKSSPGEETTEKGLMRLILFYGICFMGISSAFYLRITIVAVYLPILFLIGAIIANAGVFWQLLLQANTPSDKMGRVSGIATLTGNASLPIAYGIAGIALNYIGIALLMLISGLALILLSVLFLRKARLPVAAEIDS